MGRIEHTLLDGACRRHPNRPKTFARSAGVEESPLRWHLMHEKPWFENHISTIELRGRYAVLKVEKPTPEHTREPRLRPILERRLT
jgi:hypothetical protein